MDYFFVKSQKSGDKFYWQGMLGAHFEFDNEIQSGMRLIVPRITSLTRTFAGPEITNGREIAEQLSAVQLVLGFPLVKE